MARDPSDHGKAQDAIDWVLDVSPDKIEAEAFLRCWREGDLGEWPEFYVWLDRRETEAKAWRKAEKARLKGWRLPPAKSDAGVRAISEQGSLPPADPSISTPYPACSGRQIREPQPF